MFSQLYEGTYLPRSSIILFHPFTLQVLIRQSLKLLLLLSTFAKLKRLNKFVLGSYFLSVNINLIRFA